MNADLLAMLGAGGLGGAPPRREPDPGKTIATFKAGKMNPVLQENGKYLVTADSRRGQISLIYELGSRSSGSNSNSGGGSGNGILKFEWKDRRTRSVIDSLTIFPEDRCTFTPVPTGREGDRVYLLQFGNNPDRRFFFWMQDKYEDGLDENNCKQANTFLSNVNECIVAAGGEPPQPTTTSTPSSSSNKKSDSSSSAAPASNSGSASQVDALSSILENLGMPQPNTGATATSSTTTATPSSSKSTTENTSSSNNNAPAASTTGGGLTLADLQGAMAGLATHSPAGSTTTTAEIPGPPLNELATSDFIDESGILENPDTVARLTEFLPEGQRTPEMLRENLRSPQVQQALQSLTMALSGDAESYHSIIANFQLEPQDGAAALASGNPIQAFLDCVIASVKKEKDAEEEKTESKEDDDEKMSE